MTIIRIDARDVADAGAALLSVPPKFRDYVIPRALNDTGDRVYTGVIRSLAEVTGAPSGRVRKVVQKRRSGAGSPEFEIRSRDTFMSLKDFKPRRTKKGVSAAPWNNRQTFPGSFFGPGGHVFVRMGRKRLPIEKLWGPAIPREMVRKETAALAISLIQENLPKRVAYWTGKALAKLR